MSAFGVDWDVGPRGEPEISYCFPPFCLIPRVIQHIRQCKAKAVIIVPEWLSQSWWVGLWRMAVGHMHILDRPTFDTIRDSKLALVTKLSFTPMGVALDGAVMWEHYNEL